MIFLIHWLITTIAILIAAYLLPGVTVKGFFAALVTALVLGLINTFIRPILLILTLPINILTLGLFTFVINALLIMLTSAVVPGFDVRSFWWALLFSLVLSLIKWALNAIVPV
jgi:putative membrane protein